MRCSVLMYQNQTGRDECLHRAGFHDNFKAVKDHEDQQALDLLPDVLKELDALRDDSQRLQAAIKGAFAGNVFDLGAAESAQRYQDGGGVAFADAKEKLLPRPWVSATAT
eukprot:jgi/Chrzof1/13855/Cz08g15050.t1